MPRPVPKYNATSTSETIQYQISSGAGKEFIVWQDNNDSNVKLVKCDLCGRFMRLQGQTMSTSLLRRHRDGEGCKELQVTIKNANQISTGSALSFINMFQAEVGPSNVHLPHACEFMHFQFCVISILLNHLSCCTAHVGPGSTTPTHVAAGNLTPQHSPHTSVTYLRLPPSSPPSELELEGSSSEIDSNLGLTDDEYCDNLETIPDDVCTGQLVEWLAGSVWDTYAYQQHNGNVIGWTPIGYEDGNWIRLQSKYCSIFLQSPDELNRRSCEECFNLLNSKALLEFMDCAGKDTIPHMPWKYLNTRQLKNMLLASRKKLKLVHLKVCLS
jgi:hypothetical protein